MESTPLNSFFRRWLVNTLGVMVAANTIAGIQYDHWSGLLAASLMLGVFNAFLRPVLVLFALPLVVLSLGLFLLVINASLVYLIGYLVSAFHVADFWAAFKAGLVISLVSHATNWLIGPPPARRNNHSPVRRAPPPPPRRDEPQGPIIDV